MNKCHIQCTFVRGVVEASSTTTTWVFCLKAILPIMNEHPHKAAAALDIIDRLRFEILEQPTHSPDLAPFDYLVFGPLKDAVRGQRFENDDKIKEVVHFLLKTAINIFFLMEERSCCN